MTEWCTTRSIAAAVAMGLAKMRSHSEKTRFDVMPNVLALVAMSVTGPAVALAYLFLGTLVRRRRK